MKSVAITIILIILLSFQKGRQDIKLDGKYRMEYETEYAANNCVINISKDKYVKIFEKGSKKKGWIEIIKHKFGHEYLLQENNSELQVLVEGTTFRPSDTIYFRTKKIKEKEDENELTISSGKLIKIR